MSIFKVQLTPIRCLEQRIFFSDNFCKSFCYAYYLDISLWYLFTLQHKLPSSFITIARLKVTVLRHKINSTLFSTPSPRAPYVKFRVGHRRKRAVLPPTSELKIRSHSCSSLDKFSHRGSRIGWKEKVEVGAEFEFKVTYHEHLFWALQVQLVLIVSHLFPCCH